MLFFRREREFNYFIFTLFSFKFLSLWSLSATTDGGGLECGYLGKAAGNGPEEIGPELIVTEFPFQHRHCLVAVVVAGRGWKERSRNV